MSKYAIESTTLTNIASAIRSKKGTSDSYTPLEMPAAIRSISGGGGGIGIEGATEITITNTTNDTLKEKNIYNYGKYTWIPSLGNGLSFTSSTYGNSNYQFPICISDNKWLIIAPGNGSAGTNNYYTYAWLATIDENNNVNIDTTNRVMVITGSSSGNPPFLSQVFNVDANHKLLLFGYYNKNSYYYKLVRLTIASEVNSIIDCTFNVSSTLSSYSSSYGGASGYFDEETSTFIFMLGSVLMTYKIDINSSEWITYKSNILSPVSASRYFSAAICKIRSGQFAVASVTYSSSLTSSLFTINVTDTGVATRVSYAGESINPSSSADSVSGPSNLVAIGNDENGNVYLCHATMSGYPTDLSLVNGFTTYKVDINNTITLLQNTSISEKYGIFRSFGGTILPLNNNLFLFVDVCGTSCYRLNQNSGSITEINYVRYSNSAMSTLNRANYIPIDDNNILIMTCTNGSSGGETFILLNYDMEGRLGYQTVVITDEMSLAIQSQGTSGPLRKANTDYFLYNRLDSRPTGQLHDAITSKWFYNISPSGNIMHNLGEKLLISKIVEQDCITKNGNSLYKIIPTSNIAAGQTGQAYLFK